MDNQEVCSICLCDLSNSDIVQTRCCKNKFHSKCYNTWFLTNNTCPLCRNGFKKISNRVHPLINQALLPDVSLEIERSVSSAQRDYNRYERRFRCRISCGFSIMVLIFGVVVCIFVFTITRKS